MGWKERLSEGPLLVLQRIVKILFIRGGRAKNSLKAETVKLRHGKGLVLREVQGSKMYLNTADKGISNDLYSKGIRENKATLEMQKRVRQGMVIADIGANIGYYALMEAKAVGPKGKVYAIEPIPENVALLKKNVEVNDYKQVEVFEMAIGDKQAVKEIFLSNKSNLATFCENQDLDMTGERKKVKVQSLDGFLKGRKQPQMVRMDVEGYEFEILQGMKQTLAKSKDLQVFIEVHPGFMGKEKTKKFYHLLRQGGLTKCRAFAELPDSMKLAGKIVSKKVLPDEIDFSGSIEQLMEDERFYKDVFHLFAAKK